MKTFCDNLIFVRFLWEKKCSFFYRGNLALQLFDIFGKSARFSIFRILTEIFANKMFFAARSFRSMALIGIYVAPKEDKVGFIYILLHSYFV